VFSSGSHGAPADAPSLPPRPPARRQSHLWLLAPRSRTPQKNNGLGKKKKKKNQVDAGTGEIAGVFESIQPSDTDLGAKASKDVKVTGLWYAQLK